MTTQEVAAPESAPADPPPRRRGPGDVWADWMRAIRPAWLTDDILRGVRYGLIGVWIFSFAYQCFWLDGIPWLRSDLLLWIAALLVASSVGKRSVLTVLIDFLPFAAVLIVYDYLRGISETMGMPTWWHPQVDVDKFLFAGTEPTVWLQERLKYPDPRWYDVVVALCYFSFFFLPYVTAGVLWLRSRASFYRWSLRFVVLSFVGFTFFALTPAAPPWAAARCTDAEVANHPNSPYCMYAGDPHPGGLLGPFTTHQPGANPFVDRISTRGFGELHLHFASEVIKVGQNSADAVAAVPSLHLGGTFLFVIFMWSRLNKWWRPLLVAYPLLMTFSLVYSGEHFVSDCLAGVLVALLVHLGANRIERWRKHRPAPDTLEAQETPPNNHRRSPRARRPRCR